MALLWKPILSCLGPGITIEYRQIAFEWRRRAFEQRRLVIEERRIALNVE